VVILCGLMLFIYHKFVHRVHEKDNMNDVKLFVLNDNNLKSKQVVCWIVLMVKLTHLLI